MVNLGNLVGELHQPPPHLQGYPRAKMGDVQLAMSEAWAWLEAQGLVVPPPNLNGSNGWRVLSRRARMFESEAEFAGDAAARMLPKDVLHPSITDKVWLAFIHCDFDIAVFQAFKQVEIAVCEARGADAGVLGVKLARWVRNRHPHRQGGRGGERQARLGMFAGALGSYKNPQSHRHVALDDPIEAIEQIIASHLLRVVHGRVAAGGAGAGN